MRLLESRYERPLLNIPLGAGNSWPAITVDCGSNISSVANPYAYELPANGGNWYPAGYELVWNSIVPEAADAPVPTRYPVMPLADATAYPTTGTPVPAKLKRPVAGSTAYFLR